MGLRTAHLHFSLVAIAFTHACSFGQMLTTDWFLVLLPLQGSFYKIGIVYQTFTESNN